MKKNKLKEKIILLGGTIGIGAISLAITLMVYNVQLTNNEKVNYTDNTEIVYNADLTESQKIVADNLIAKLNELQEKNNQKTESFSDSNISENEIQIEENNSIDNDVEFEKLESETNFDNAEIEITKIENNNINNSIKEKDKNEDEKNIVETIAKVNKKISFQKPVEGKIGMVFSDDKLIYSKTLNEWSLHNGVDILADVDTNVKACETGKIKDIYEDAKYGFTIVIEHDEGYVTKYSGVKNNNSLKIGMELKQGDVISQIAEASGFEIGEGSHLHFEILKDGVNIEPDFI